MSFDVSRLKQWLQPKYVAAAVVGISALIGVFLLINASARREQVQSAPITNGEKNVSVSRDIVIAFAHPDADEDDIRNHFVISPMVEGELSFDGANITLEHEKNLEYNTKYLVRINKGVLISRGTPLPEDYEITFTTQTDPAQRFISPLSYSGFNSYSLNAYDARPAVSLSHYNASQSYRIQLYRSSPEQYVKAAIDLENVYGDALNAYDFTQYHDGEIIDDQKFVINGGAVYHPKISQEGVYLAKVSLDEKEKEERPTYIFLVNSKIAHKTYRLGDQLISRVVDQRTGDGVKGVVVSGYSKDGNKLFSDETNNDGLIKRTLKDDEKTEKPVLIKADAGSAAVFTRISLGNEQYYINAAYRAHVFTDRPLYAPGDTVHFKAVVWPNENVPSPESGAEVMVQVQQWGGNSAIIYEKNLKTNSNGSITDSVKLTKELKTGDYMVFVKQGETVLSSVVFSVEFYQKPDFEVNASLNKAAYVRGDKIRVTVKPQYYFGGAVSKGTVEASLGSWGEKIGQQVSANLVNGSATLEIPTKDIYVGGWWAPDVFVDVTVIEEGGRRTTESKQISLHRAEFEVEKVQPENTWYLDGTKEHTFIYKATRPDGSPEVGRELVMTVQKDPWTSSESEKAKNTKTYKQKTNTKGEVTYTVKFTGGGYYYISVAGTDARGNETQTSTYAWTSASGSDTDSQEVRSRVFVSYDKKEYNIGDTALITIELPGDRGDLFWSVNKDQFENYKVQQLTKKQVVVEVPVNEKMVPGFYFYADMFHEGSFTSDIQSAPVNGKKLVVKLTAPGEATRPGEQVSVGVYTTDEAGLPVAAETSLSVVDKSIFALKSEQSGNIHTSLYPMPADRLRTFNSVPPVSSGFGGEMGCFTGDTMILMKGGALKQIKDVRVGDIVLTHPSELSAELREDRVVRTFIHHVDEYLVINGMLNVTKEHRILVNGEWKQIGEARVGDWLTDADGNRIEIRTIENRNESVTVYNLQTEKYHTFIANGIYVHNDKGGGASVSRRSNFVDTAYWNAFVTTDEAGNGIVTFTLPDNTTTWAVSAKGVSDTGFAGQSKTEFLTTKPVVARLIVPQFVRTGDTITIVGAVQNGTDSDRSFKTLLTAAGATIKDASTKNITVKKGSGGTVSWQLAIGQSSQLKLALSAVGGDQQDAIEITIPVYEALTQISTSYSGNEPGLHTFGLIPDSDTGRVQGKIVIAPSVAAIIPEVIAKLTGFPYGCVEQTMSRHLPNILAYRYTKLGITIDKEKLTNSLNEGFDRLAKMQHGDGGFGWWEHDSNNAWMSGYVLEGLTEAKQTGLLGTREVMLTRLVAHLKQQISQMKRDEQVYIAYALAKAEPGSTREISEKLAKDYLEHDIQSIGYLALASHYNGDKERARELVGKIKSVMKDNHWELDSANDYHGALKDKYSATGVSLLAVMTIEPDETIQKNAVQWLMQHRTGYDGLWGSTRQSSQILFALAQYLQNSKELSPSYTYTVALNGTTLKSGKISSVKDSVTIPLNAKMLQQQNSLAITKSGNGNIYWTLQTNEFVNETALAHVKNDMPVKREYLDVSGKLKTSFAPGEMVRVRLTFAAPRANNHYAMIEDYLPAALQPYNAAFENQGGGMVDRWWWYDEMDIRDHKVAVFRGYVSGGNNTIEYDARVMFRGSFTAPAPTASFMYEPEITGFGVPSAITVK